MLSLNKIDNIMLRLCGRYFCSKSTPNIIHKEINNCGILQIYREKALNAINCETFKNLYILLNELQHKNKLVIFKGNGKVFSSGGDIKELTTFNSDDAKEYFQHPLNLFRLVHNYKVPYIPLMSGICFGAASNLTIAAKKYRVATETTDFAMPEAKIGYVNDNGSSYFLSRVPRNVGYYISLACPRIKGYDMIKIGLADYYIESYKLSELEEELVKSKNSHDIESTLKRFSSEAPKETELDSIISKIDKCFDSKNIQEIYDNLSLDGSEWSIQTLQSLNSNSPVSLKVCHKELSLGKSLTLDGCLKMEYCLAVHHFVDNKSDFKEGVRALLIDRVKPQWKHATLQDVNDEYIDEFFKPLAKNEQLVFKN